MDLMDQLAPEIEKLRETLEDIELKVTTRFTLADAIREGSTVTGQEIGNWYDTAKACALSAAAVSLVARGIINK